MLLFGLVHVAGHQLVIEQQTTESLAQFPLDSYPDIYHGSSSLWGSFPAVTGCIMLASLVVLAASGLLKKWFKWSNHTFYVVHRVCVCVLVVSYILHGTAQRFNVFPYNGVIVFFVATAASLGWLVAECYMPPEAVNVDFRVIRNNPPQSGDDPNLCVVLATWTSKFSFSGAAPGSYYLISRRNDPAHVHAFSAIQDGNMVSVHIAVKARKSSWTRMTFNGENRFADDDDNIDADVGNKVFQLHGDNGLSVRGPFNGPISGIVPEIGTRDSLVLTSTGIGYTPIISVLFYLVDVLSLGVPDNWKLTTVHVVLAGLKSDDWETAVRSMVRERLRKAASPPRLQEAVQVPSADAEAAASGPDEESEIAELPVRDVEQSLNISVVVTRAESVKRKGQAAGKDQAADEGDESDPDEGKQPDAEELEDDKYFYVEVEPRQDFNYAFGSLTIQHQRVDCIKEEVHGDGQTVTVRFMDEDCTLDAQPGEPRCQGQVRDSTTDVPRDVQGLGHILFGENRGAGGQRGIIIFCGAKVPNWARWPIRRKHPSATMELIDESFA